MRSQTEAVARWSAGLAFDDIPEPVREAAGWLVLDGIGCGLYGATTPWGEIVTDFAASTGHGPEASIWGTQRRVPVVAAPLANGTFIHAFELDDLHPEAMLHGAAQVVPAALAIAELRERGPAGSRPDWLPAGLPDSRELLTACVAGFEVGAQIGLAFGAAQLTRGFHPSPNTGTFSAAITAGRLLGLDAAGLRNALGIAGSFGGSLMSAQYGAMVKRVHPGRASQAGVTAALLAARGLTGIQTVLEEPYGGFGHAYAGLAGGLAALDGLGRDWETPQFSIKAYPCCGSNHTTIDAYRSLLSAMPSLTADQIDAIEVRCSTMTKEHVGWPYTPDSVTSAQMNLAYTLAVLATDRQISVEQFRADRLADPAVLKLISQTEVVVDPEIDALGRPGRHAVRLTVTTQDGERHVREVTHPRGSRHHPLTEAEIRAKYRDLAGRVLPGGAVAAVERAVLALTGPESQPAAVGELIRALAGGDALGKRS